MDSSPAGQPASLPQQQPRYTQLIFDRVQAVVSDSTLARYYVSLACTNLLRNPQLPGDNYGDQIVGEALRLHVEDGFSDVTRETRDRLLAARRMLDTETRVYHIFCPWCDARFDLPQSRLAGGPISDAILSRLLFKHWREVHRG